MDAEQIRQLRPRLVGFLSEFNDCFARKDTRAHLPVYVEGQLSDLPAKSVEPIALNAGVAPRTLQEFLSLLKWDEDYMRDRLQEIVRRDHLGAYVVGLIDETSFAKKGKKTPGVQRQWCGSEGKKDNCVVTVHLGLANEDFHCLLDGELYLPESWADDWDRRREARIPDEMTYRPKWEIGLELYDRARSNGIEFPWLTFDEGYGGKPPFLRALVDRNQRFVAEVPRSFTGWITPPKVTHRQFRRRGRGRGRKTPRLVSGARPAITVANMLKYSPALRDQPWERWRVKDGVQGPMVWEVKHVLFYPKDVQGLPDKPMHLIVARNVLNPEEMKFFVSNAPPDTPLGTLLLVAFSRWHVERCFEDQKGEVGLDHYEGRRYPGLKRHLILSSVSHLFLAKTRQELAEKKESGIDGLPGPHRDGCPGQVLVA
jgi:SRSO17 transposase